MDAPPVWALFIALFLVTTLLLLLCQRLERRVLLLERRQEQTLETLIIVRGMLELRETIGEPHEAPAMEEPLMVWNEELGMPELKG